MVDRDLISKKLALIETLVRELRVLGSPDRIETDVREERFVAHSLQLAIQAALDVASHIVSDRRLGEPQTNRELFDFLTTDGWLTASLRDDLRAMAGFRNIIVHGYERVDLKIMRSIVETRLGDLLDFVTAVGSKLDRQP